MHIFAYFFKIQLKNFKYSYLKYHLVRQILMYKKSYVKFKNNSCYLHTFTNIFHFEILIYHFKYSRNKIFVNALQMTGTNCLKFNCFLPAMVSVWCEFLEVNVYNHYLLAIFYPNIYCWWISRPCHKSVIGTIESAFIL